MQLLHHTLQGSSCFFGSHFSGPQRCPLPRSELRLAYAAALWGVQQQCCATIQHACRIERSVHPRRQNCAKLCDRPCFVQCFKVTCTCARGKEVWAARLIMAPAIGHRVLGSTCISLQSMPCRHWLSTWRVSGGSARAMSVACVREALVVCRSCQ